MDHNRTLQRLRTLSATPAAASTAAPPANGTVDLDRLRRLARGRCAAHTNAAPAGDDNTLPGQAYAPGVRLIERALPEALESELVTCALDTEPLRFEAFDVPPQRPDQLLCVDTETTGLSGGTGTRAFLIGLLRWQNGHGRLQQWLLTAPSGEAAMLSAFNTALADDPTLVSYNGKSFDLPLLRTRLRLAALPDATRGLVHLDLLYSVRRHFRDRWSDCRLATAERFLLGVEREDDLPGSEAPAAFRRWLQHGDPTPLSRVVEHNAQDLVSLAQLSLRFGTQPGADFVLRARPGRGQRSVAHAVTEPLSG